MSDPLTSAPPTTSNFLRSLIERDLEKTPTALGEPAIVTRFPPEPNGYLHIGHAKSIVINFGLAQQYGGKCHMRFDDTNPEKESDEYVQSILDTVRWLGYSWNDGATEHLYFASDYFEPLFEMACALIRAGHAYVDSQTAEEIRLGRGNLTHPGIDSPFRNRSAAESLQMFQDMRAGKFADGSQVLRAKIDMLAPNINLRDPVLYRIRRAHHHRTGDAWCIYPMYDYTHPISDALEKITHSLCTLEFEDHRPLYNWLLTTLQSLGYFAHRLPQQTEFARLNLSFTLTSKRKLLKLVTEQRVRGWDDPRLPTLAGLRRRGYTPAAIRLFCDRAGVSKADSWIDVATLEGALRETLELDAARAVAVIDPLELVIDNFPEGQIEACHAPIHPNFLERGQRHFAWSRQLWITRDDFQAVPEKGFFRLTPGARVRLRHGFVVQCTGFDADETGRVTRVHCDYFADSKSGTDGANLYKVKGNIHWLSWHDAVSAEFRLYERLFLTENPEAQSDEIEAVLNPDSEKIVFGFLEQGIQNAAPLSHFQFERVGYFVSDAQDHTPAKPVFNLAIGLKK